MVVNDARNVCPAGWTVPSDQDWFYLENKLLGACIYWKETKYYYLDKLFIITKGYGKQMLQEWIELKKNKCYFKPH